jgi:hypothetical protein
VGGAGWSSVVVGDEWSGYVAGIALVMTIRHVAVALLSGGKQIPNTKPACLRRDGNVMKRWTFAVRSR